MPSTSIIVDGKPIDIGIPVYTWKDPNGFNGYLIGESIVKDKTGKVIKVIKGPRYSQRPHGLKDIRQAFTHHSGGDRKDPSIMYDVLWKQRGLSVHFAGEDDGRIYQFLDVVHSAWHASSHNGFSFGTELCLFPFVNDDPSFYSPENCKKRNNLPHDQHIETIQNVKRNVYMMPEAQIDSYSRVVGAVWAAVTIAKGIELTIPKFPRNEQQQIPKEAIETSEAKAHVGLIAHMHTNAKKSDPAGFNWELCELLVERYVQQFYSSLK
jgi:hypothetical protein